ncbi:POU domain, class 4, transcription factor 3-like [Tubulanus polymorphus]|uniref:POU domain, class 4, transcription factor 3-like n=1 Tax=Tubulanus polymorphus TaxID=672921 RepID=UPI003DA2C70E
MMMMNPKPQSHLGMHHNMNHHGGPPSLQGRYSPPPYRPPDPIRRMSNHHSGNIFGGLDDSLLARAEALAAADIHSKASSPPLMKHDSIYGHTDMGHHNINPSVSRPHQMGPLHGFTTTDSMLDQMSAAASMPLSSMTDHHNGHHPANGHHHHGPPPHQMGYTPTYSHPHNGMNGHPGMPPSHHNMHPHTMHDQECDPRELEAFAERFKQRRIKLGVTQADVGSALGKLKLPGVGSLSQSTICRFESLTLSHNNMIALKPVLQAWLEEAERVAREKKNNPDVYANGMDKKRKRTSIAAPEKRSLEAYFAVQPRPSGEKIAQIAEKLDLKKNVVRVWFCNQRQKQKRMKFSAVGHGML